MAKKIKDTDYLAISARVRAMENDLLTAERMEQLLAAHTDDEAVKLLQSFGYPELDLAHPEAMDEAIGAVRLATLEDLSGSLPDAGYLDVFKIKYDYHNVKALLKAEAMGTDAGRILMDLGRVDAAALKEALRTGEGDLPGKLREAAAEAREVLDTTRDPQLGDVVLDRWYYRDLLDAADATGSDFLWCVRCAWVRPRTSCAVCWSTAAMWGATNSCASAPTAGMALPSSTRRRVSRTRRRRARRRCAAGCSPSLRNAVTTR